MSITFLLPIVFLSATHASISGPEEKTAQMGGSVEIKCRYDTYFRDYQKYWCKGYYRKHCTVLVQTNGPERKSHDNRIKITADNAKGQLTVHMNQITANDKGWYWCGIDRPHLLDPMSPVQLKVYESRKGYTKDKERLRLFLTLGIIFGILMVMFLGLVILVVKKIRKHKDDDGREKESTIENSIPKSNSVLSKELEEGVTYASVTIQPNNHPQDESAALEKLKTSNSQDAIKPAVAEPPASEPTEYSTVVFKKSMNSVFQTGRRPQIQSKTRPHIRHSVHNIGQTLLIMKVIEFIIILIAVSLSGSHGLTAPSEVNGRLGGTITVNCQYNIASNWNSEKYWCKGNMRISCTVLASTTEVQQERSSRLFIMDNQTIGIFSVKMQQLTLEDAGWYWCGITRVGKDEMTCVKLNVLTAGLTGLRQVHGTLGDTVTVQCQYPVSYYKNHEKYLCKGSDRKSCIVITGMQKQNPNSSGRIIAMDNQTTGMFAVTITQLSMEDEGIYWCGVTTFGYDRMDPLQLIIFESPTTTVPPAESQRTITFKSESASNFSIIAIPALGIMVALSLVVAVFATRYRKKTAVGEKELKPTKEDSNPVYTDLSFRDYGEDITYDIETSKSLSWTQDFPTYICEKQNYDQKEAI
ncbi:polymeric immunoglobulin receptor-like [Stegostoma tigrinum]|uniref:polymeric immunoglobulin receptor-like n=1 Tax=Stegostoma tigrinum TaxID=3053191 RepID=UPI00287023E0|nr:polymeric immunoglobulin receptor-like [Stegostoma tigrinum]